MRRRTFTAGAVALAAAPGGAWAQAPGRVYRIALCNTGVAAAEMTVTGDLRFRAFFEGMGRRGYVEGGNLAVSRWSSLGVAETQFGDFVRPIVAAAPDLIVTNSSRLVLAFKNATTTIPIVMLTAADPVAWGLVERLNRPGGNITGFATDAGADEATKRMQFLAEAVPGLRAVAYLTTPIGWTNGPTAGALRNAASRTGLLLVPALVAGVVTGDAIRQTLASLPDRAHTGIVTDNAGDITSKRLETAQAALELKLPVSGFSRRDAEAGLLMSYSASLDDIFGRAPDYVDRILKGANPGDLPVQLPTTFEFVINMKTAKALGLTIPERLSVFATEVIEE